MDSSSLLPGSMLVSVSGSLGSGVLTGSGSGIRLAADPVTSSSSVSASCSTSSRGSSCA